MRIRKIRKISKRLVTLRDLTTSTGNFVANNIVIHNSHISALLLLLFYKFTPELIKQGRVHILQTPLWGLVNVRKKEFIPFKERPKPKNGYQIMRFKGLGEFASWQFERFVREKQYWYTPRYIPNLDIDNLLRNKKLLLKHLINKELV